MRFSSELPCTTHIPREEVAQSIADMESPVGKLSLICRKYGATLAALKLKAYRSATSNMDSLQSEAAVLSVETEVDGNACMLFIDIEEVVNQFI